MKINKMPTTILLLGFSWLVVILGFFASGYLIISGHKEFNSLISGLSILLGTLFLALIIRMFGNAGQILFDLLRETQGLKSLHQGLTSQLQEQGALVSKDLQALLRETSGLTQGLKSLHQGLTSQLQEQGALVSKDLQALLRETSGLTQGLNNLHQGLTSQLQEQIIAIRNDLQALSNTLKQMGCHSKDINQNINRITAFFEQIERHLDLKK